MKYHEIMAKKQFLLLSIIFFLWTAEIYKGPSIKDVRKIWPPSPLYPHILTFYRQKLTGSSAFGRPPSLLRCGRPLWMTPNIINLIHILIRKFYNLLCTSFILYIIYFILHLLYTSFIIYIIYYIHHLLYTSF